MTDSFFTLDALLRKQLLFDFIIPLASVYVTTYLAIKTKQKSDHFEKNQYLKTLKQDACIKKAFQKLNNLNVHKYQSFLVFIMGVGVVLLYFSLFILIQSIVTPVFFICLATLFNILQIAGMTTEDVSLIFGINYHSALIPLFIIILILAYSINCNNRMNIIHPILIKSKKIGKEIQILRFKLWSIGTKSKPIFTDEMILTQKSINIFHFFPFLFGIILTVNFLLYYVIFYVLLLENEEPFTFSLKDLPSIYLKNISVSGSWDSLLISVSLLSLAFVVLSCLWLYQWAFYFLENSRNEIIRFYSKDYPFICIKTTSGILEGKIENIFDKHFILLNNEGTQKITSWNKVGIIEMKKIINKI